MGVLPDVHVRCLVVGGGPAGMMTGYLLARAGVDVVVLEKHADFNRDFRGDTIHPSTLELLHELGLLEEFLRLPTRKVFSRWMNSACRSMSSGCGFPNGKTTRHNRLAFFATGNCSFSSTGAIISKSVLLSQKASLTRSSSAACPPCIATSFASDLSWKIESRSWMIGQKSNSSPSRSTVCENGTAKACFALVTVLMPCRPPVASALTSRYKTQSRPQICWRQS